MSLSVTSTPPIPVSPGSKTPFALESSQTRSPTVPLLPPGTTTMLRAVAVSVTGIGDAPLVAALTMSLAVVGNGLSTITLKVAVRLWLGASV
jgi:hypothetical protein